MKKELKTIIKKIPLINTVARKMVPLFNVLFPTSRKYWEKRYVNGENSGEGSYGKLARFKAEIINSFVKHKRINSVIEFGCGDGNQLSHFDFPSYIGLDVSRTAIKLCLEHFKNDKTKSFFLYGPECFEDKSSIFKAELALSLDVIFHLIEDDIFELYMKHLFSASDKFVIIYSSDTDANQRYHVKHRNFSKWVEANILEWEPFKKIKNRYPNVSSANFFIYKKIK